MTTASRIPPPPDVPDNQRAVGETPLRFEDLAQDGRLRLEGVWPPIGPILWGKMDIAASLARLGRSGVRAVLTYVALEGTDEPLSVRNRIRTEVRYRLGHTVDASGAVNRLTFDTWLTLSGPRGEPNAPGLPSDGPEVIAARAYGQHVLTKPAAPPGQHRVLALDDEALPAVPPHQSQWVAPFGLLELPVGATALTPSPVLERQPVVFGLSHTDGNQHVNFLAYPRLAEEAALRRFDALGKSARVLARRSEVGYRKPCFAGQRAWLALRPFELEGRLGAVVSFHPAPDIDAASGLPAAAASCIARLVFG
ncbi:MAG: hypothetical protein R3B13_32145 [Polyangiaceae bacterium]